MNSSMYTDDIISKPGWGLLPERRKQHILCQVSDCLTGKASTYFQNYFNWRHSDIHTYSTRSCNNLNVEKINKSGDHEKIVFFKAAVIYNSIYTIYSSHQHF